MKVKDQQLPSGSDSAQTFESCLTWLTQFLRDLEAVSWAGDQSLRLPPASGGGLPLLLASLTVGAPCWTRG